MKWMTVTEVAQLLNVSRQRIVQLDAQLKPSRLGTGHCAQRVYDPKVVARVLAVRTAGGSRATVTRTGEARDIARLP